jgi:hypothetical protein
MLVVIFLRVMLLSKYSLNIRCCQQNFQGMIFSDAMGREGRPRPLTLLISSPLSFMSCDLSTIAFSGGGSYSGLTWNGFFSNVSICHSPESAWSEP